MEPKERPSPMGAFAWEMEKSIRNIINKTGGCMLLSRYWDDIEIEISYASRRRRNSH